MLGFSCKQFREGSKAKKGTGCGSERVRVRAQVQLRVRVPERSGRRGFGFGGAAFGLEFKSERISGCERRGRVWTRERVQGQKNKREGLLIPKGLVRLKPICCEARFGESLQVEVSGCLKFWLRRITENIDNGHCKAWSRVQSGVQVRSSFGPGLGWGSRVRGSAQGSVFGFRVRFRVLVGY